jgi:hypothetical protein
MPLMKLQFRPGINQETTRYMNEGGWYDCDKIRFRYGVAEKIGGWTRYSATTFEGICRKMHNWVALDASNYLALGTHLKLYIEEGTNYNDITPDRKSSTLSSGSLSATSGSAVVTITDNAHGAITNDYVTITNATTFAGIPAADLNKEHIITRIDGNTFTITVATTATSTATGGGTPTLTYQINTGLSTITGGTGWGASTWDGETADDATTTLNGAITNSATTITLTDASSFPSAGQVRIGTELINYTGKSGNNLTTCTRGVESTAAAAHSNGATVVATTSMVAWGEAATISVTSGTEARLWSFDNFGEDLIANVRDGNIYYWDKSNGLNNRAVALSTLSGASGTPTVARQVIVSDRDRHVIAFACDPTTDVGTQDPLLIRFSDQEDPADWTPTATNTAGDLIIGSGSKFVAAIETKREILVYTDASLHTLKFIGAPFTFGISQISTGISIIGPNAAVAVNDGVFWMGENQFYVYDGRTTQIPCSVRAKIFDDLNLDQRELVTAALNSQYNEVWWFYPSLNSTENDKYVVYNYEEKIWYFGTLGRTAWVDAETRSYPVAAAPDNNLYNHENGNDDGSNNPATAITSFIESSPMSLEAGDKYMLTNKVLPDITFAGSTGADPEVTFELRAYNNPGESYGEALTSDVARSATSPVEQYTDELYMRLRGRSFSLRLSSSDLGTQWRVGVPRVEVRPDGKR